MGRLISKIFVGILFAMAFAVADPYYVSSEYSADQVRTKLSELEKLRNNSSLSYNDKQRLDALWKEASEIEKMNDRCSSISLSDVLDESCETFYAERLPQFETEFFNVTGEIRLSATRLMNSIQQQREAITACYEALQIEAFYPSRLYKIDGAYEANPLTKGVEVSYDFSLETNESAVSDLKKRLGQWMDVCGEFVLKKNGRGFTPMFREMLSKSKSNADEHSFLYFKIEEEGYTNSIGIFANDDMEGTYYLNSRKLFSHILSSQDEIAEIRIKSDYGNSIYITLQDGRRWRDSQRYTDGEVEDGLQGRFVWGIADGSWKPASHRFDALKNNSSNSGKSSQPSLEDIFHFHIQSLTGFYLSDRKMNDVKADFSKSYNDQDSVSFLNVFLQAQFTFEFDRWFAVSASGGGAWSALMVDRKTSSKSTYLHKGFAPIVGGEISFGEGINGGVRCNYLMDSDYPTTFLGGFVELGNLLGLEVGWAHSQNLWDNIYIAITLRIPPRFLMDNDLSTKK